MVYIGKVAYEYKGTMPENSSIELNDGTVVIGVAAFSGCSGLTTITIPNSVITIGASAFRNCSALASVEIPNSVTTIGYSAFRNCSSLTSITIPQSVTSMGDYSFTGCSALTSVSFHCSNITSWFSGLSSIEKIEIGKEVKAIGYNAFKECNGLRSVTFDQCEPFIDYYAFSDCPNITDVYYPAYAYSFFSSTSTISSNLHPQIKIDREWTTYCATASFDVPDGIEAYVVKNYNEGVVTLKKVTTINKGQGLLLKPAEVGTFYDATLCASTPGAYETNLLRGVTSVTDITATDGDYTNFIFTKVGDEIGFYPASAGIIPAYKAYLQIPTASLPVGAPARLSVVFEDGETTSITPVRNNQKTSDEWYTLGGQRSTKPTERGIYIHEGKKVIIK